MIKYTKRVLSLIFASILILNLLQTNVYAEETVDTEGKVYSDATLEDEFADNRVMVVLDNETSLTVDQFENSMFAGIRCNNVKSLTTAKEAKVQEKISNIAAELNAVAVARNAAEIVTTENVMKIAATDEELSKYNQVLCIELEETGKEKVLETISELEKQENVLYVGPDYVLTVDSTTPNDPGYTNGSQWAIDKIKLPEAWDITTGSPAVYVAVIDTGIDGDHPEFVGRVNSTRSRDFTSGTMVTVGTATDDNGHGTAVAGVIGAYGNDNDGICGTCWNVRLVSLKILDSAGEGYSSYAAAAIDFAELWSIPIINMSVNWKGERLLHQYDVALETVISTYSGLFVSSAGNNQSDNDLDATYPANYNLSNIIVVGATNEYDVKSSFSNYGQTNVDLFAPGEGIYTTSSTGGYITDSGTSYAAPYVAGVAALMLSIDSSLTAEELKEIIERNVDTVAGLSNYCVTGGRLNAFKALSDEALHDYTPCSQWTVLYHRYYCSDCQKYILRYHTFAISGEIATCTECGYNMDIMIQ